MSFAPINTVSLFDVPISRMDLQETMTRCLEISAQKKSGYVCFVNVHTLTESTLSPTLHTALCNATFCCPDGVPLVMLSHLKNQAVGSRVCGPDFMEFFLSKNPEHKMGFIGSTPQAYQGLVSRFGLKNSFYFSPPHRPFSSLNAQEDWNQFLNLNHLNEAPPIVWIGLGAPKQELWMNAVNPLTPHTLFLGVGAAFDFLGGTKKRAPPWMQKMSLEWAHRLFSEPKRLGVRYFKTNMIFIKNAVSEIFKK